MPEQTYAVPAKPFWKSRTFWVGVLTILVSVLLLLNEWAPVLELPPHVGKWALFVAGILQIILRFGTNQPVDASREMRTERLKLISDDGDTRKVT